MASAFYNGRRNAPWNLTASSKPGKRPDDPLNWPGTWKFQMLTLSGTQKAYDDRVLFADGTLQVNRQHRIGLVGPNAAGKTTLFSIILGEESADAGQISFERGLRIGYLPQENAPVGDETVIELATAISPE